MKRIIVAVAVSISTLLATPVFAGNEGIATNVDMVAFQQKLAYCINNAQNEGFNCNSYVGCSERKHYVASCMNGNDTQVRYASINRGMVPTNTDTAVTDYNKVLQEAPTAAGAKLSH